jgi:hypothetical protein
LLLCTRYRGQFLQHELAPRGKVVPIGAYLGP